MEDSPSSRGPSPVNRIHRRFGDGWLSTMEHRGRGHGFDHEHRGGGHADTPFRDHWLSTPEHRGEAHDFQGRRAGEVADHFPYDPTNPVPATGGNMCCDTGRLPAGAQNQNTVEERNDVLVYTSAPLEHDVAGIGTVNAALLGGQLRAGHRLHGKARGCASRRPDAQRAGPHRPSPFGKSIVVSA